MIREIKWKSHPILGDLVLDLTKPDGTVFNSIVLAGENGTGKTTILETLSTFLNRGSISQFEYIKYEVAGEIYTIQPREKGQYADASWHVRTKESTGEQKTYRLIKEAILVLTMWMQRILDTMDVLIQKHVQALVQRKLQP